MSGVRVDRYGPVAALAGLVFFVQGTWAHCVAAAIAPQSAPAAGRPATGPLTGRAPSDLVAQLKDADWRRRNAAAETLDALPPSELPVRELLALAASDLGAREPEQVEPLGMGRVSGRFASRLDRLLDPPDLWLPSGWRFRLSPGTVPQDLHTLGIPFSTRVLAVYLLRRLDTEAVRSVLAAIVRGPDGTAARQAALALAGGGSESRAHLIAVLGTPSLPDPRRRVVAGALADSSAARATVESWIERVPWDAGRHLLEEATEASEFTLRVASRFLGCADDATARLAARELVSCGENALPVLRAALADTEDPVRAGAALAATAGLGPRGRPLAPQVLARIGSTDARLALWAPQVLNALELEGEAAAAAAARLRARLGQSPPVAERVALVQALGSLGPPAEETLGLLRAAAADGDGSLRQVGFDGLLARGRLDLLDDRLEPQLEDRLRMARSDRDWERSRGAVRAALQRLPLADVAAALRRAKFEGIMRQAGPFTTAELDRMRPCLDGNDELLHSFAVDMHVDAAARGTRPLPEDFFAATCPADRLKLRLTALTSWKDAPDPVLTAAFDALDRLSAEGPWIEVLECYGRRRLAGERFLAALRGPDTRLAGALRGEAGSLRGSLAKDVAVALLDSPDADLRSVGVELALRLEDLAPRVLDLIATELASADVARRSVALKRLAWMPRTPGARTLYEAGVRTLVEALAEDRTLGAEARFVLQQWCCRR